MHLSSTVLNRKYNCVCTVEFDSKILRTTAACADKTILNTEFSSEGSYTCQLGKQRGRAPAARCREFIATSKQQNRRGIKPVGERQKRLSETIPIHSRPHTIYSLPFSAFLAIQTSNHGNTFIDFPTFPPTGNACRASVYILLVFSLCERQCTVHPSALELRLTT